MLPYPIKTAGNQNKISSSPCALPILAPFLLSRNKSCSSIFSTTYLLTKLTPIPREVLWLMCE